MNKRLISDMYISLFPKTGVVDTGVKERAMGRLLQVPVSFISSDPRIGDSMADLASDVFFSLYKADPQLVKEPPLTRYLNTALIRLLHNVPNFASLHNNTTANIPVAMHTGTMIVNALLTDEAIAEAFRLQERLQQLMQQLADFEKRTGEGSGSGAMSPEELKDKQDQQREKIKSKIDQAQQQLQDKMDSIFGNQLSQGMMMVAVDKGHEGADEINGIMTTWGVEAGEVSYHDANKLIELANKYKDNLAMIADLGGRLVGVTAETMQAVRDSYVGAPSEPTFTRDLTRMFPTERAYMSPQAPSAMRINKVSQWAQRGLLGLRPKSEGKKRGALVIAVDGSSSMNMHLCTATYNGKKTNLAREHVARILATGVARAMREDRFERRRFTMFTFSTDRDQIKQVTSADSWQDMVDWIAYDPNGGTSFNVAFSYALDEMEKFEMEGTYGADLLFISDGEARMGEHIKRRLGEYRDRTGARVFYLQVCDENHAKHWTVDYIGLQGLVDAFVVITETDAEKFDDVPAYLAQQVARVFTQVD